MAEGDDVDSVVVDLAGREAVFEAEQSPGLPWSDLVELFGQRVEHLGLDTADIGNGSSRFFMKWTEENIKKSAAVVCLQLIEILLPSRLIRAFERRTVTATKENGQSLLHLTLLGRKLGCAELLFNHAERESYLVDLCWNRGDILGAALERGFEELVEFVLDRIAKKCACPNESARVISNHFGELRRKFPQLLEKSIRKGRFCFEYGRFEAPLDIFKSTTTASIARIDDIPEQWEEVDEETVRSLWTDPDLGLAKHLDDQSGPRVTAVSKFVLIESPVHDGDRNVVSHMVSAGYKAELFMCETVKALAGWRWHHCIEKRLRISVMNRFGSALLFFVFDGTYGLYAEELGDSKSTVTLIARTSITLCYIHFLPWLFKYALNPTIGW